MVQVFVEANWILLDEATGIERDESYGYAQTCL